MKSWPRTLTYWLLLALGLLLILFLSIGPFLSPHDDPQGADVIIVVSGGGDERVQKGMELYKLGYATLLVFSGDSRDEQSPSNAAVMKNEAVRSGIPPNAILTEEDSKNTYENAMKTKALLDKQGITVDKILLVTSSYHQRRCSEIFASVFPDAEILNESAEVSFWSPWGWWKTSKGRALTLVEVEKILYGWMTGKVTRE